MSKEEKKQLLWQCHTSSHASHNGVNLTLEKVSRSHHWHGIKRAVQEYVAACDQCQRQSQIKTAAPELQPIKVVEPWHMVGMDLIGPLKETRNGYKYVLTLTDYFTKFVDFHPLKSKSSLEVANGLQTFFMRWGPPKRLLSDQGREFVNELNDALAAEFRVKRMVSSAYHPQTNGLDERTNKTLKNRLAKLVNESQDNWDMYLEKVAFSMRTSTQKSTKYTPFFLMFRREPVLPHHMALENIDPEHEVNLEQVEDAVASVDVDNFIASTDGEIDRVTKDVLENVEKAQSKQKDEYRKRKSKGVKVFDLKIGDRVLRRNMRALSRKGGKMDGKWLGPYRIASISAHNTLLLVSEGKERELKNKIPYDQVKPYVESEGPAVEAYDPSVKDFTAGVRNILIEHSYSKPSFEAYSEKKPVASASKQFGKMQKKIQFIKD